MIHKSHEKKKRDKKKGKKMGMRISTNVTSINAQRTLTGSQRAISKSMAQLASGSRITKAADDAAGLAISESLKSQIRSFTQAQRNANDGISMIQTAEGGLTESANIVTRLRELAMQAASDTVGNNERALVQKEVTQLTQELDRIANSTAFGSTNLLNGSGENFDFQVGIHNSMDKDVIQFDASQANSTTENLGIEGLDFSSKEGATSALDLIDEASSKISGFRAQLGAVQNRLQSTSDNIAVMNENLAAANSRIRDTDIAEASSDQTRNAILMQASTGVLSQANMTSQLALKLIG